DRGVDAGVDRLCRRRIGVHRSAGPLGGRVRKHDGRASDAAARRGAGERLAVARPRTAVAGTGTRGGARTARRHPPLGWRVDAAACRRRRRRPDRRRGGRTRARRSGDYRAGIVVGAVRPHANACLRHHPALSLSRHQCLSARGKEPVMDTTTERVRIVEQHGFLGTLWLAGWLFTIGYLRLAFVKGVAGILLWPYYLGAAFSALAR